MTKVHEVWADTGESVVRDATIEEQQLFDAIRQKQQADKDLIEKQIAMKQSAMSKLVALGLTDAEIAALVG